MEALRGVELSVLVGAHAQRWHLGVRAPVTATVRGWRDHAPLVFPLPHPSWRNTAWLRKNPWFEADLLPAARQQLRDVLSGD